MDELKKGDDNAKDALLVLIKVMEERDSYSKFHSVRVKTIAMKLARMFQLEEDVVQTIGNAAMLHDIGMLCVPDTILMKPGGFTSIEREVIRNAPLVAAKILEHIPSMSEERLMILHHGERWDGSGYPDGLKEAEIPVGSRFIAIAEAIDAKTRNRAYRKPQPLSFCIEYLEENAGVLFDPKIASVAIASIAKGMVRTHSR